MKRVELDFVDGTLGVLVAVNGALDDVPQLADIARPVIGFERGHRARGEAGPVGPVELDRHAAAEMLGQQRYVALPRPQRRQGDDLERQAVEEVSAEVSLVDLRW